VPNHRLSMFGEFFFMPPTVGNSALAVAERH